MHENDLARAMEVADHTTAPPDGEPQIVTRLRAAPDFLPANRVYVDLPAPVDILLLSETVAFDLVDRRISFTLVENVELQANDFLETIGDEITELTVVAEDRSGKQIGRWVGSGIYLIDRKFEKQWVYREDQTPAQVWTVTVGCNKLRKVSIDDQQITPGDPTH